MVSQGGYPTVTLHMMLSEELMLLSITAGTFKIKII